MTKLAKKLWLNTGIPIILIVITIIMYLTFMFGLYFSLLSKLSGSFFITLFLWIIMLGRRGLAYHLVMNPEHDDEYVQYNAKRMMDGRLPFNPIILIFSVYIIIEIMRVAIEYNSWLIGVITVVVGIVQIYCYIKVKNYFYRLLESYKESEENRELINNEITKYIAIHVVSYIVLMIVIFLIV